MLFRRTQSSATLDYTAGEKVTHFSACERGITRKNKLSAATSPPPDRTQVAQVHLCRVDRKEPCPYFTCALSSLVSEKQTFVSLLS